MRCPFCNEENTRVIDTRTMEDNRVIKRRRQCDKCGRRFTTHERVELIPTMVIKKDESREPYNRSKVETGIVNACHKRPVSRTQITQIVDKIVINSEDREVRTSLIGELVMEQLKEIDEVAYVRFASVYREFRDVNTFLEELEKLSRA
jgi:transcriptional repressor NrdR